MTGAYLQGSSLYTCGVPARFTLIHRDRCPNPAPRTGMTDRRYGTVEIVSLDALERRIPDCGFTADNRRGISEYSRRIIVAECLRMRCRGRIWVKLLRRHFDVKLEDIFSTECTKVKVNKTGILHILEMEFLPPATKLGQGYIFTGVCDSVHRGGLPQCMLGYHPLGADTPPEQAHPPRSRHPPRAGTPPGSRHPHPPRPGTPQAQSMLGDMLNGRAVRVLLECNLVQNCI